MVDKSVLDEYLPEWLRPVTVSLTAEQMSARRRAVVDLSGSISRERAFVLVASAYGRIGEGREWIEDAIREQDSTFSPHGQDSLIKHVAAAVCAAILASSNSSARRFIALLAQSATFAGLTPVLDALPSLAQGAVEVTFRADRRRSPKMQGIVSAAQKTIKEAGSTEAPAIQNWDVISKHFTQRDKALVGLARRVEDLVDMFKARQDLSDEELDVLWWSYANRSTTLDKPWHEIEPPEHRGLLSAGELLAATRQRGMSVTSKGLLALALGDRAQDSTTFGRLATSAAELDSAIDDGARRSLLLPLTSLASIVREFGSQDDTWKTVSHRTLSLDADSACLLVDGATQWLRELEIRLSDVGG